MILSAVHQNMLPVQPIRRDDPERALPRSAPAERQTGKPKKAEQLTAEEKKEVQKLRARDREVRAHEQAHQAAGGQYVTHGATYSYQQGPDGQRYASGGEVGIDTSAESDPQATLIKMQVVRAAALAPASPSGQDRQVAAQAARKSAEARSELSAEQLEKNEAKEENVEIKVTVDEATAAEAAKTTGTTETTGATKARGTTEATETTGPTKAAKVSGINTSPSGTYSPGTASANTTNSITQNAIAQTQPGSLIDIRA